ncbi:hypothetical protein [Halomicronema sp. CCY15110]|uniref:hypothetical protein n=1 Tax=Halomicronema sp. CCY15110 TaxID=2767773 RepID=UPI00194F7D80|nr:hypothetical protein [Halomicronema sp. CCY15110]
MTSTAKQNNNRSLTLDGLNALFAEAGIAIERNDALSIYEASYRGLDYQGKTLLDIGRQLIKAIADESSFRN